MTTSKKTGAIDFIYGLIKEYEIKKELKEVENRETAQECRRCNESGDCWICILQ
ncbi:MAG: hypothetical protein GY714_10620 [Desulfobacterales bacterium]|nr:hypothetical protein [Desulfobacterales bacterium]